MGSFNPILVDIPQFDIHSSEKLREYLAGRCVTDGGLGLLGDYLAQLAGIQGRIAPTTHSRAVLVFTADHGVVTEGISKFAYQDTADMVKGILQGKTAVGVLTRFSGISLACWDVGLKTDILPVSKENFPLINAKIARGTQNFTQGPAMFQEQCVAAIDTGRRAVSMLGTDVSLLVLGEMGMGNTTAAAALTAALLDTTPERVVGRGAGNRNVRHKAEVVVRALQANHDNLSNPLEILSALGGLEIAALVGACLEGAARRLGIILDGFVTSAAALIATTLNPLVKYYLLPSHLAPEPGQELIFRKLGLRAPLDLGLRIGEGAGGLLLCPLLDQAEALLSGLAGFVELGIEKK